MEFCYSKATQFFELFPNYMPKKKKSHKDLPEEKIVLMIYQLTTLTRFSFNFVESK